MERKSSTHIGIPRAAATPPTLKRLLTQKAAMAKELAEFRNHLCRQRAWVRSRPKYGRPARRRRCVVGYKLLFWSLVNIHNSFSHIHRSCLRNITLVLPGFAPPDARCIAAPKVDQASLARVPVIASLTEQESQFCGGSVRFKEDKGRNKHNLFSGWD